MFAYIKTKNKIFLALLTINLASCAPVSVLTPSSILSTTQTPTYTTVSQIPTALATEALSPTLSPLPLFPLDGYVMVFVKNGDLYFQDGHNVPVKLTYVGEKSYYPKLSDDNRKVVFSRNDGNEYSINTDGTQEQIIITKTTNRWTAPFEPTINKGIFEFIPGTHQLLFETFLCESQEFRSPCSTSIFLVDTDTGKIKKLADLGLSLQQNSFNRNIRISPNGKIIAVGTLDGVDIFTLDGKIIRHNILPYKPSQTTVLFPALFWLPDSIGLIVALPNIFYDSMAYNDDFPASTIWRYTIDSNVVVQIPFDPPPMLDTFEVSPNGKWIVYGGLGNEPSVYLGNLEDGHTEIAGESYQTYFSWAPDSEHFIASSAGSVLGGTNMPMSKPTCQPEQWIDARHFTCFYTDERIRLGEISAGEIKVYDLGFGKTIESSVFMKPK